MALQRDCLYLPPALSHRSLPASLAATPALRLPRIYLCRRRAVAPCFCLSRTFPSPTPNTLKNSRMEKIQTQLTVYAKLTHQTPHGAPSRMWCHRSVSSHAFCESAPAKARGIGVFRS